MWELGANCSSYLDERVLAFVCSLPLGRLMIASLCLRIASALLAGKGPIENLNDHLADPGVNNGFAAATKFAP
jgi:hypothetical protein